MIECLFHQPVDPAETLELLRAAYHERAVADHLTYETRRDDGTFDAVHAVIEFAATDAGRRIRYETSGFAFTAEPGALRGARTSAPEARRVLVVDDPGRSAEQLLTATVPLGPLPQCWIESGTDVSDPSLGVIRFTSAVVESSETILTGASAFGAVDLRIDSATGRLIRLSAAMRDGSLELRASPVASTDPETWVIPTENRRPVQRIDQLAPSLPMLEPGGLFPDLTLVDPDGVGIEISAWQEDTPASAPRAAWSLLVLADGTEDDPVDVTQRAMEAAHEIRLASMARPANAPAAERFWLRHRTLIVLVLDPAAELPEPIGPAHPEITGPMDVLYTFEPGRTIDRLPMADIVAVAFDRERVIGAIGAMKSEADASLIVEQMVRPASNPAE